MIIYLARHGETDYNVAHRVSGRNSPAELTEKGYTHARNLSLLLKNKHIDAIYSSPLKRAYETALETAKQKDIEIITDERIIERDCGILDGLSENDPFVIEEYKKRTDKEYRLPKGESYVDVILRVNDFYDELNTKGYQTILQTGHQGVNRVCISVLLDIEIYKLKDLNLNNNIIYEIDTHKKNSIWHDTINLKSGTGLRYKTSIN